MYNSIIVISLNVWATEHIFDGWGISYLRLEEETLMQVLPKIIPAYFTWKRKTDFFERVDIVRRVSVHGLSVVLSLT